LNSPHLLSIADNTSLDSQIEKVTGLESEGQVSTLCSAQVAQNIQGDCTGSFAAFGETQIYGGKEKPAYNHSPSYCDDKSAFSSMVGYLFIGDITSHSMSQFILDA
jgi:hypothetical protein